jgi:two-component system, NtrC family, nitrogen regulation response regulator NtrX
MTHNILIIDDEADIRNLISDVLEDEGYKTRTASGDLEALSMIDEKIPTVIILDIWLQGSGLDGLSILELTRKKYPYIPVVIISGHGNIETAVTAIKMGAYDYIEKPFTEDKLKIVVQRAIDFSKLQKENNALKLSSGESNRLVGNSLAINNLKQAIIKLSQTSSRVLITGANGVGKKLAASFIHKKSKREQGAFIIFSASKMSEEKAYLELFGEESKDVFSHPRKVGALELANMGTLFIDEVSDLPLNLQYKLLNFLQNGSFTRGNNKVVVKLDVRVISSTSKNLKEEIAKGTFSEELFHRLSVTQLHIPSLSERQEDIPMLSEYFIRYFYEYMGLSLCKISSEVIAELQNYQWPGNIRQFRNVIEWLLIIAVSKQSKIITIDMLTPEIVSQKKNNDENKSKDHPVVTALEVSDLPLRQAREVFEIQYLTMQLSKYDHNITKMSNAIGMDRSALHRKLKNLGLCDE